MAEIMVAMADQIRSHYASAIDDLDLQVEPKFVYNPSPPTIDIYPGTPGRDSNTAAFDDLDGAYRFVVRARVAGDQDAQQELLIAFMDDTDDLCIAFALMDDPTLNGYANSVSVESPTGFQLYPDLVPAPLLGVQWPVTVIAGQS